MYAHQVIEDRKKYFNKPLIPMESGYMKIVDKIKNPDIVGSICFSLPFFIDLLELSKTDSNYLLNPINTEYLKMPFPKIWIDGRYSPEDMKPKKKHQLLSAL